jgi:AcrR family transcriptional regulator
MTGIINDHISKQKLLVCAVKLFAEKGFTETSVRELAEASGLTAGSVYNHFDSKNAILENILDDFAKFNSDYSQNRNIHDILQENPTLDGIMSCFQLTYPEDMQEYYLNILCMLLQEQLRNPIVKNYMCKQHILRSERTVKTIINTLKDLGVISQDTDADFWMKITSSLFYTFAARSMLGIGDQSPEYSGKGMNEMLRGTFDILLDKCGLEYAGRV